MDADKLTPSSTTAEVVPRVEIVIDLPPVIEKESRNEEPSSSSSSPPPAILNTTKHSRGALILTNCHVGYFRISLSLCAQTLLWKTLIHFNHDYYYNTDIHPFNHDYYNKNLPYMAFLVLWSLALLTLLATSLTYLLKCIFHFESVKDEFFHHVSVNYFFAPWTSALLLLHASPFSTTTTTTKPSYTPTPCQLLWWLLALPILILDIKIYGGWFTTRGKRFLSRIANPASQLSVIANLIAARAYVEDNGSKEVALCLFSLGMAHYLVLFVTLYQRLPGGDGLPMTLRPVFFLFIATPSMASLAWGSVNGSSSSSFDVAAKMLFCLSLFLFCSLVCRPKLFKNSMKKFSVAWWAYCFSLTLLAVASIEYAKAVKARAAHAIMLVLSVFSILVLFVLLIFTVMNVNSLLFGRVVHVIEHDGSSSDSSSMQR